MAPRSPPGRAVRSGQSVDRRLSRFSSRSVRRGGAGRCDTCRSGTSAPAVRKSGGCAGRIAARPDETHVAASRAVRLVVALSVLYSVRPGDGHRLACGKSPGALGDCHDRLHRGLLPLLAKRHFPLTTPIQNQFLKIRDIRVSTFLHKQRQRRRIAVEKILFADRPDLAVAKETGQS